jgi:hypothetical protein
MIRKRTVSVKWLRHRKACGSQVELFQETFGESAPITRENLIRAAEAKLNLGWLAWDILDDPGIGEYTEAAYLATMESFKAIRAARIIHRKAITVADAAYFKSTARDSNQEALIAANSAHRKAVNYANMKYQQATTTANEICRKATATALADLLGLK